MSAVCKMDSNLTRSGNRFGRALTVACALIVTLSLGGCATLDKNPKIRDGLSAVGDGLSKAGGAVKDGFGKIARRGRCAESSETDSAPFIVSQYPLNEMPHTMLKKPVGDGRLSSTYGCRLDPKGIPLPKKHNGIDYAAPTGTPVYAAESGTIERIYKSDSYGNYISIAHDNDFITAYAHLNAFADGLAKGTAVTKGQIIGQIGNTGRSSGAHLHFELKHKGRFIDPLFVSVPANIAASEKESGGDS